MRLTLDKRLRRAAEFNNVFRRPTRSNDALFSVAARCRPAAEMVAAPPSRLGLAISRKALARAVDRNRIKRIVREVFRHTEVGGGIDFVVVARAGLRGVDNAAVMRSIETHFRTLSRRLCSHRAPQAADD